MNLRKIGVTAFAFLVLTIGAKSTYAGLSGDPAIDIGFGTAYKIRAGGSGPGVNVGGNVWKCGSSGAPPGETECPNSATFTPAEATGGSQSWAVGVAYLYDEEFELECSLEWEFNPLNPWLFEPVIECGLVPALVPDGTLGRAMTILKWGSENSATQAFSNEPTSLLAYNESLLDACTPTTLLSQFGQDAPCFLNFNHSYVPDNGYESDIRISDPACNIPLTQLLGKRVHGPTDSSYNCFTYYQYLQISNLPGYYRDTTYLDDADEFNIGFGSSEAFALDSNTTYVTSQIFGSTAHPNVLNTSATHDGAITTHVGTVLPVITSCAVTGGLACYYFTVKDAEVGGASDTFTQVLPP